MRSLMWVAGVLGGIAGVGIIVTIAINAARDGQADLTVWSIMLYVGFILLLTSNTFDSRRERGSLIVSSFLLGAAVAVTLVTAVMAIL